MEGDEFADTSVRAESQSIEDLEFLVLDERFEDELEDLVREFVG